MLSIKDASTRERAAAAALRQMPRETVAAINRATKSYAVPLVIREAAARAGSPLEQALARTGRGSSFKGIPGVGFGGTAAVTADGARGRDVAQGAESGARGRRQATYTRRSTRGLQHQVTRHTTRQFGPYVEAGRFIGPAVTASTDAVLGRWTDDVERALVAALDKAAD